MLGENTNTQKFYLNRGVIHGVSELLRTISSEAKEYTDMFPDRPDDNSQTVFCQTCDEWTHPRSDCARSSGHDTAPLPIMKLIENGPLISSEIKDGNGLNPEARRQHNVSKFNPMSSARGPSDTASFQAIYYLEGTHPADVIIKQWMESNERALRASETTSRALAYNIPDEFKEAWDSLKNQYGWLSTNRPEQTESAEHSVQTCPNCGDSVKNLPRHIRACDGQGP